MAMRASQRRSHAPTPAESTVPLAAVPVSPGRGWDLLMVALAVFILTSVARVHQLFPVLALVRPVALTGVAAIALCLLDRVPRRRLRPLQIPATRYLIALIGWMALSVPGALWPGGAFTTFVDFLKTGLMFLVLVTAVRSIRDVEKLALVYFLGAVIFAAVVLSRTQFQMTGDGRMERLYYYDSNDFATYAITALPLGLYFAATGKTWLKGLAWGGIGVLALGFIWSGSRGGFLAFLGVIAYFLLRYTTINRSWRWSAVVAIAVIVTATAGEKYWTRILTIFRPRGDYNLTEEQGRVQIWRRGLGYMIAHPVLGVGAGNFPRAEGTISPLVERTPRGRSLKWGPPHNSYVQVAAELGLVGFVIFCGFLVNVFKALRPPIRGDPDQKRRARLAQSLTASLIGFAVGSFFLTLAYADMLYALAGIAVGLRQVTVNSASRFP